MNVRFVTSIATVLLATSAAASSDATFAPDGKLNFPANYREWVYLSSGLDMSYNKLLDMPGHSMFDNVFADPVSYHEFLKTGTWPEGTILVMEARGATGKAPSTNMASFNRLT